MMTKVENDLGIAVDAWCKGNPGKGGYRGIDLETGEILFEWQTDMTTNNIVEFLAIAHGQMWCIENKLSRKIWSDSKTAIAWVRDKKIKTNFDFELNPKLKNKIDRAIVLITKYNPPKPKKWDTQNWGDIPADFGNKTKTKQTIDLQKLKQIDFDAYDKSIEPKKKELKPSTDNKSGYYVEIRKIGSTIKNKFRFNSEAEAQEFHKQQSKIKHSTYLGLIIDEKDKEKLYPFFWQNKRWDKWDCHPTFLACYPIKIAMRKDCAVYLSEGTWIYPDGTFGE